MQNFEKKSLIWWQLSDNRIGISFIILFNYNNYLASLELSLSAHLYTHLAAHAFSILKNNSHPNFASTQLQCPTSPDIFWQWIFFKITHQSGQLFLKEEIKLDQKHLKATRLAVSFLSNCIIKILILNIKYK